MQVPWEYLILIIYYSVTSWKKVTSTGVKILQDKWSFYRTNSQTILFTRQLPRAVSDEKLNKT